MHGTTTAQGSGYSASYNQSTSETVATYSNGVTTETITYYNVGVTLPSSTKVTVTQGSSIVSYWQESDFWDEGCYCRGFSEIDEISDPTNNFAHGELFDNGCPM
jgi:hypothetical protein